jgi:hypothetical protein
MTITHYSPDWPSITAEFPPHIAPPRLLAQFVDFLRTLPEGSLGSFTIAGARLCDGALPGGDDLAERFGLFCHFGDGSQLGYWFADGGATEHAPIVLIAHDDAPALVAPSLAELLWRIVDGNPEIAGIPHDFQPDDDDADARPILREWLNAWVPRPNHRQLGDAETQLKASFDNFVNEAINRREQELSENPTLQALALVLRPYWLRWVDANTLFSQFGEPFLHQMGDMAEAIESIRKSMSGQSIPDVDLLEISAANDMVEITKLVQGERIAVPEAAQAVPLILQLRQQQLEKFPERGLWHYASITLGEQGQVTLHRAQQAKPQFAWDSSAAVAADLANFPRSAWWQLLD